MNTSTCDIALYTQPGSPRIWRVASTEADKNWRDDIDKGGQPAGSGFEGYGDETLRALEICTDDKLARLAQEGFTGIWFFCKMSDLMVSTVFPELNDAAAIRRLASLQAVVERAGKHGLGVYLYFNDPVGLPISHPFWESHSDLTGATKWGCNSWCTSQPIVRRFFADAIDSIFARLHDVAGVILITACESLTHCWSKSPTRFGAPGTTCVRCAPREPADIVLELLHIWADVSLRQARPFRVIAWNWEWSYWYEDPQAEIVQCLPEGVELLLDMEIGGIRHIEGRDEYIGEYSLGYVGPGERFLSTRASVAGKGIPIHAKIQINNTHELATVPNLPVLRTLHAKFKALSDNGVAGFLACWSIGCRYTLNTAALRLYLENPERYASAELFLGDLARHYFGEVDSAALTAAWGNFSEAFFHYPFSVQALYYGPHNDAPALPLSLHYKAEAAGSSFAAGPFGDDLARCFVRSHADHAVLQPSQVIAGFAAMVALWETGLAQYEAALEGAGGAATAEQTEHRRQELSVATMLGIQLRSTLAIYRFYDEVKRIQEESGSMGACELPAQPRLLDLMAAEVANAAAALPLLAADCRLGYHEEAGVYKYNLPMVRAKLQAMGAELAGHGHMVAWAG